MRGLRWLGAAVLAMAVGASHAGQPAPRVVLVQPSSPEIPANLLRISIEFAAPVEGPVLARIALSRAGGTPVEAPFLQQELWSPDAKILTILMHPGRVKTGLNAREQLGPILEAGDDVALTFDGHPVKHWTVGPVDASGPVASAWQLLPVRAASRQALVVLLDGPVDGRDVGYLAVVDASNGLVQGRARLTNGESTWTFTPKAPWRAGDYRLVVRGTLEDPAGNRLGGHFETSIAAPAGPAIDAAVPFSISPATGPRIVKSAGVQAR